MLVRSTFVGTCVLAAIAAGMMLLSTEGSRSASRGPAVLARDVGQTIRASSGWIQGHDWNDRFAVSADESIVAIAHALQVPAAFCYAEGTPEDHMVHFEWAKQVDPGPLAYFLNGSWATVGTPTSLTWSLVPDGVSIFSTGSDDNGGVAANSELFARLDLQFGGNRALWISLFDQAFERWEQLSGITYTRVTDGINDWDSGAAWGTGGGPGRGDVRIAMRNIDGGSSVLAYNFYPTTSDMVIDRSEFWAGSSNNYRFLRDVLMHELGHGLGFRHVCSSNSDQLMEPFINTSFDGPQHDDLRAVHRNYGDPMEPDNSPAEATDIGALAAGGSIDPSVEPAPAIPNSGLLSLDAENEQDWFRFQVASDLLITATVTPQGTTYDNSTQNSNGSCNTGNPFDSLTVANLVLELYSSADLVTPMAIASFNPSGSAETIIDAFVTGPDEYYVRVSETGAMTSGESQNYTLQINALAPPACCLPDGVCAGRAPQDCPSIVGFFYGSGTDCGDVLVPACEPADAEASLEVSSTSVAAGGSVLAEIFIANATDLSAYQFQIEIERTSGTGTISVPCPDGALINQLMCHDTVNFLPTGVKCDTTACPGGQICLGRPDYVFAGQSAIVSASCSTQQVVALLDTPGANVDVGATPIYSGEFVLEVSPDAAVGSTFEVSIVAPAPDGSTSFMTDPSSIGILFRQSTPVVITVADVLPPLPVTAYPHAARKQRYVSWRPDPGFGGSYAFQVTHTLSGQAYFVSEPLTTPAAIIGKGITRLTSSAAPILFNWSSLPVVHTTGCQVAPGDLINTGGAGHAYEVRSTVDGLAFSAPLIVQSAAKPTNSRWWADIVGTFSAGGDGSTTPPTPAGSWTPPNLSVSGFDISAALQGAASAPTAPDVTWGDMNGEDPDRVVNGPDVLRAVNAFSVGTTREFYPFRVPVGPGDQGQATCLAPAP